MARETLLYRIVNDNPVSAGATLGKVGTRTNQSGADIEIVALVVRYPEANPATPVFFDDVLFALKPQGVNAANLTFQDAVELCQIGAPRARQATYDAARSLQKIRPLVWPQGRELELHLQTFTHAVPARGVSVMLICETKG